MTASSRSSTVLDARVAHLLERLIGELRLEREHEPRRVLARRVGDDVELDRELVRVTAGTATAAVRASACPPFSQGSVGAPWRPR